MLRSLLPNARFALVISALIIYCMITTRKNPGLVIAACIISIGICYGLMLISTMVSAFFIYLFSHSSNRVLATLLPIPIQATLTILLFRIKRFSKGFLFLNNRRAGAIGLVMSGAIMMAVTLINRGVSAETGLWLLGGVLLCISGLILWWRRELTVLYRKMVKERNITEYEKIIAEKDALIQNIRNDNEIMARIIHRDNKLLPALRDAVLLFMANGVDIHIDGNKLLIQIEEILKERSGDMIQSYRPDGSPQVVKDTFINSVLNQMMFRASAVDIKIDVASVGSLSKFKETGISDIDAGTLLADLIENAIIATINSDNKRILITFGQTEDSYEIGVHDSGRPFEMETLLNLGTKRASTHLDDGGSGIGYMTIFKILRGLKASLIITEYSSLQGGFVKSVIIQFDSKDRYIVRTYRAEALNAFRNQSGKLEEPPEVISFV